MTVGIICEYNPPHRGHAYQLAQLRRQYPDCRVICVMSGNFVQRGTPAVCDKYLRARAALALGADAVVELPFPYSCAPAELFARAGVHILAALGIDALCFGTEGEVLPQLETIAAHLDSAEFTSAMEAALSGRDDSARTVGYPVLRERVFASLYGDREAALLRTPNNTLAVEYLRALSALPRKVTPIAIPRTGDGHDAPDRSTPHEHRIVSASAVRARMADGDFDGAMALLPTPTAGMLWDAHTRGQLCTDPDTVPGALLLHHYRTVSPEVLSQYAGLSDGLAGRLCRAAEQAHTAAEMLALASSKSHTHAAIRRAALYGFFGVTTEQLQTPPSYTLLLAANTEASPLLRRAKKAAPNAIVAACGCYAQTHQREVESLALDVVGGTGGRMAFIDDLERAYDKRQRIVRLDDALRRREFELL
ncbi:MAG: nucleotidyltransferase family protein, partial [Butyricicoccus sp.]|nr:nucleotidyltransferase family protein [Butyricicoccus sp.]